MTILAVGLGLFVLTGVTEATSSAFPGQKVAFSYSDCSDGHAKILDVVPHAVSNIGWKVPINVTFEAEEEVTGGNFSLDTDFDILGRNATPSSLLLVNCSGDASLGLDCKTYGSYEDYKKKNCAGDMADWACKALYQLFARWEPTVKVDGLRFPVAPGSFDLNMELGFVYPFSIGDVSLKQMETKVTSRSKTEGEIFCVKVWQGAKQKNGMRSLTYQDCGDSQTHAKVVGLQPLFVRDGEKARVHAKVIVGTAVSAASGTVHVESHMTVGSLASCSGDAALAKSCPLHFMYDMKILLPMWLIPIGTLKYRGLKFPIQKGASSILVDLWLDPLIPSEMVCTSTRFKASTPSGKTFLCVDVHTNKDSSFGVNSGFRNSATLATESLLVV